MPRRFLTLDAMRGIAALVVMAFHLSAAADRALPGGYLAVDLFFVLSGFVLAHAYGSRALGIVEFMRTRLTRLYPLYFAGLTLGVVAHLLSQPFTGRLLGSTALGLFFVPSPFNIGPSTVHVFPFNSRSWTDIFPFDPPAWSLFFELLANMTWFALLSALTARTFLCLLLASAVALVVTILHFGSVDVGTVLATFGAGVPRVFYSFLAGAAVYRLWCWRPATRIPSAIPVVAMIGIFAIPFSRTFFDAAAALVLFPGLVFVGASVEPPRWAAAGSAVIGRLSYAIYTLHMPIIAMMTLAFLEVSGLRPGYISSPIICVTVVWIAWAADRYFDTPVRRWLGRKRHFSVAGEPSLPAPPRA